MTDMGEKKTGESTQKGRKETDDRGRQKGNKLTRNT
jgi:hypothetical protein